MQAGNVAFQQQRFTEAAEQYTEGLSQEVEDRNLRAVLHTNRAAAALALGRPLDAIADCCMAAVHDPGYLRLYQRRAEAYTAIMDYASASQVPSPISLLIFMDCNLSVLHSSKRAEGGTCSVTGASLDKLSGLAVCSQALTW